MPGARYGDTVCVHYRAQRADGQVVESSHGEEPLQFTIGEGQVLAGFEKAVIGLVPGQSRTRRLSPAEAYGARDPAMVFEVERHLLPDGFASDVGEECEMSLESGVSVFVRVIAATEQSVTFDANHPLAGQELTFHVRLVDIVPPVRAGVRRTVAGMLEQPASNLAR